MSELSVPRLRSPVVLVHGFMGYGFGGPGSPLLLPEYFLGVPRLLRAAGNRVHVARLSPTGSVAWRAGQLAAFIDRVAPAEAVHVFAHSMGGLDARYMVTHLGMASRVLSLTTLGTPHRGTAAADWGLERFGRFVEPVLRTLRLPYQGFLDLTTPSCARFNADTPDAPGVRYFSVAGVSTAADVGLEWRLLHGVVGRVEGDNDGIISVASARWGEAFEVWDCNHVGLVNWSNSVFRRRAVDRLRHYAELVRRLADCGF